MTEDSKKLLLGRALLLDLKPAHLIRIAVNIQERAGWGHVAHTKLSPAEEARLKRWFDKGGQLDPRGKPVGI